MTLSGLRQGTKSYTTVAASPPLFRGLPENTIGVSGGQMTLTSQRRSRTPGASDMLRIAANTLDDPEKDEVLDLMHSAEFRSLTSNDG
jgi:hypothetical protein